MLGHLPVPRTAKRMYYVRIFFPLMGWMLDIDDKRGTESEFGRSLPCIVVSNHVSYLDSVFFVKIMSTIFDGKYTLIASTYMGGKGQWELLKKMAILDDAIYTKGIHSTNQEKAITRKDIEAHVNDKHQVPILVFPEGQVHNCDKGIFRFEKFCFGLEATILPVSAKLRHPFPIHLWHVHEWKMASFLCLLMIPFFKIDYCIHPQRQRIEHESDVSFARRIQIQIARHLDVDATDLSIHQLDAYLSDVE